MPTQQRRALPSWLVGSGVIAVAMGVMNLGTYGFTIIAARLLGPAEYGALAALMGVLLVVNVVSLGLQATGARRVSAAPEDLGRIEADVLATTYRSAVVVGVVCLLAAPVVVGGAPPGRLAERRHARGDRGATDHDGGAGRAFSRASAGGFRWPASTWPSAWAVSCSVPACC